MSDQTEMPPLRNAAPALADDAEVKGGPGSAPCGREVDPATAAHLIGTIPGLVVLDVRTPVEHADGRIRLSRNMDFFADDFEQHISALDRQASYLIYCRSGGRSRFTLDLLEELGFSNAVHMPAGMEGWCAAGLPVVTA